MYEVILIDADGTLFDYSKAEKYALEETLGRNNYKGNILEICRRYRDINSELWLQLERGTITKDELRTERFKRLFEEYNLEYSIDDFSEYYLEKLGEANFLIEGAEEICKYLSEKYKVVIITNGIKKVQLSRLDKSAIKDYINEIVISEEVGVNKPEVYIFEYALNLIEHKCKKSVIMIGDSLTSDIQGGIRFEIDTCWLNLDNTENVTDIKPKYQINTLKGLSDIL